MTALPLDAIKIGSRFRQDHGDIAALARSIEAVGLLHPLVVTPSNELVCGERRIEAARLLGWQEIPVRVVNIEAIVFGEQAENELRKDFTMSERVAIGRAVEESLGERRGRPSEKNPQHVAEYSGRETRDIAAGKSGFGNAETYRQAKAIVEKGTPELVEAVDRGDVSIRAAAELSRLPVPEQREIVARGEKEILAVARRINARKYDEKKLMAVARTNACEFNAKELGKFAVIYADPPWRYETPEMGSPSRRTENHYPTMTLDEICALPVSEIANEDSVLFLWATAPKLAESMQAIESWGFTYRTNMVWGKDKFGLGFWIRNQHEHLLICKRGEMPPPPESARCSSLVVAPRLEHSAKPPVFYDIIDEMYPGLRKIELFSRSPRKGWEAWGNQAGGTP